MVAVQPTRGLDVGAIEAVHRVLLERRAAGAAILLISEDLDEILALADRVDVMYEGRIVGSFPADDGRYPRDRAADDRRPTAATASRRTTAGGRRGRLAHDAPPRAADRRAALASPRHDARRAGRRARPQRR